MQRSPSNSLPRAEPWESIRKGHASGVPLAATGLGRPSPEPLGERTAITRAYAVLDRTVRIECDDPEIHDQAEAVLGKWGEARSTTEDYATLRILRDDRDDLKEYCGEPAARCEGDLVTIQGGGCLATANAHECAATLRVSNKALQEPLVLQTAFLETIALYLASNIAPETRVPLHAAAIAIERRAAVLAGNGGAGKSTLAAGCAAFGLDLVAEDVIFCDTTSEPFIVHGNAFAANLLPESFRLLPPVRAHARVRQLNGSLKDRIRTEDLGGGRPSPKALPVGAFVIRQSGQSESWFGPTSEADVRAALTTFREQPPLPHDWIGAATARLLRLPIATLFVGSDLRKTADLLRNFIDGGILPVVR